MLLEMYNCTHMSHLRVTHQNLVKTMTGRIPMLRKDSTTQTGYRNVCIYLYFVIYL